MRKMIGTLAAAVAVALAAGCGGDDAGGTSGGGSPSPVPTVSQTDPADAGPTETEDDPGVETGDPVAAYVAGVASADADTSWDALEYAAPDSVAHAYLTHQSNLVEAGLDGGQPYSDQTVDEIDGGYQLCTPGAGEEGCSDFTELEVVDGLVVDLRVNGESPGPLLTVGDGSVVSSRGVDAEFLSAYRAISNDALFVTIRVSSGETAASLFWWSATYREADGRQRQVSETLAPDELGASSTASVVLMFPGAGLGGTVNVSGLAGESDVELSVQVG